MGVAPSSRRKIRPMKGPVRPAKTVNRSVAEMSIRSARRISGLNRDPIIVILFMLASNDGSQPRDVLRLALPTLMLASNGGPPAPRRSAASHYFDYVASHP